MLLVQYLIEHKDQELNILQISKDLGMDYKNTHSILQRLEKTLLVSLTPFGQARRVTLISQLHPLIFEAEYNRRKALLKDKTLLVMLNDFKDKLQTKYYVLLVFGSYAKKRQTKSSDIDLLFVVPNKKEESFEEEVQRIAKSLPLPLHCLVFSEEQFLEMINAKQPNVGQEALKNNVILYGIETYYEMIQ